RQVLRLLEAPALPEVDLGVRPRDAVGVALEVDVGRRLELLVEDDGEVLRVGEVVALPARAVELQLPALRLLARDPLELARAVVRELEQHHRLARLGASGAGPPGGGGTGRGNGLTPS